MKTKPPNLPPEIARVFVKDMAAYFTEADPMKRMRVQLAQGDLVALCPR
jgi:hypothetical protein